MGNVKYMVKSHIPHFLVPYIIRIQYYKAMGKKCNLRHPTTYNEKIQWSKIYRDNRKLSNYVDKIEVRKWVKNVIGEEYLIPMIGKDTNCVSEIDFNSLPERFVIKANHGCGMNLIVNDKNKLDIEKTKKILNSWLKHNMAYHSYEMQYMYIEPRLYIEKNLIKGDEDLPDYKFFCFDGKVYCLYTMINYVYDHSKGKLAFFDRDYNLLPYYREGYKPIDDQPNKPKNYEKMVEIAEKLSKGFSHVRVDLYNLNGKIFFGEMTFSTCSGFGKFVPEEFDTILGEQWNLNSGL